MKKNSLIILAASCLTVIGTTTLASAASAAVPAGTNQTSYISTEEAKNTALEHAGLTGTEVVWGTARLDREDGRTVYDIEFWLGSSEYDYELDACTGEILAYDFDIEGNAASGSEGSSQSHGEISSDEAKAIALKRAGLTAEQVRYIDIAYEYDDGRAVYQIDFITDSMEYEIEINAADGSVIEYDAESRSQRR